MPGAGWFGVFQITDLTQCRDAVIEALETGYRLFDTAAAYNNEAAVGEAIRLSGVKRENLFITTKIGMDSIGEQKRSSIWLTAGIMSKLYFRSIRRSGLKLLTPIARILPSLYRASSVRHDSHA